MEEMVRTKEEGIWWNNTKVPDKHRVICRKQRRKIKNILQMAFSGQKV